MGVEPLVEGPLAVAVHPAVREVDVVAELALGQEAA
jgi:hypothetical protein